MDEIISKLRKTQNNQEEDVKEKAQLKERLARSLKVLNDENMSNIENDDPDSFEIDDLISSHEDDVSTLEITSSQCQTPFQIMKFDFEKLDDIKKKYSKEKIVDSINILSNKGFKVEGIFVGIIRKIVKFSDEIAAVEIVDERGFVGGSCGFGIIREFNIKIGSILVLNRCSLWKMNDNHLNIVKSNIIDAFM